MIGNIKSGGSMDVLGIDRRDALGRRSDSQVSLLLFALVSLILLLSSLYSAEASVFKKARQTALETAAPVLQVFSGPINWTQERLGDISDYFRVLEQNKALREENAQLRQWEDEARSLRAVIATLDKLDLYNAPPSAKAINGFVIGESNDAYAQSMIVNAGAGDGVMPGQAVVDDFGMVGRIVDVSDNAARVLLLNDIQSRIPVFVEDSFVEGLLVGRSTTRPTIEVTMLADGDKIKPGQRVITSGAGGVLPRGLAIGVVAKIDDGEAVIDLTADYARTRMVRIINYAFPIPPVDQEASPPPALATSPASAATPQQQTPAPQADAAGSPASPVAAPEAAQDAEPDVAIDEGD
jgi:rod shape-determining protein MreC